jgi:hypothetical protein
MVRARRWIYGRVALPAVFARTAPIPVFVFPFTQHSVVAHTRIMRTTDRAVNRGSDAHIGTFGRIAANEGVQR